VKNCFIIIFFISNIFYPLQGKTADSFDLRKAILFALENAPEFDSFRRELSITALEEKSAYSRFFPALDFTMIHGLKDTSPRSQKGSWYSSIDLGLSEKIYDNGVTAKKYEIAKIKNQQAQIALDNQKNKLSLTISTQYLKYSKYVKLYEIQMAQLDLIKKQFELISSDFHQGIKKRDDFLRFKTQVSRGEIELVNSKNLVKNTIEELKKIMGVKDNLDIHLIPINFNKITPKYIDPKIEINVEDHLEFKESKLKKKINNLESDLVKRQHRPEIALTTGVNYQNSEYMDKLSSFPHNDSVGWNALVTIKYNLWDWGIKERDREVAVQKNIIQDNEQNSKMLNLQSLINALMIQLEQYRHNYNLTKELLTLEKTNIDFIKREYRNGKVSYLDLVTGLNNLADAQIKYFTAISDLENAEYSYKYHQGTLYDYLTK
jgi:outer membrane protein TolC